MGQSARKDSQLNIGNVQVLCLAKHGPSGPNGAIAKLAVEKDKDQGLDTVT